MATGDSMDDKTMMETPRLWPQWPYLRVERRADQRPNSPFCVLVSNDLNEVDPVIYLAQTWPPPKNFAPTIERALTYTSMDEIVSAGWRPSYL